MDRSEDYIKDKMTVDNVRVLITTLEIIANGFPVSVPFDEVEELCQNALAKFDE